MSWLDEIGQRRALEHRAHALRDRELDLEAVREVAQDGRRRQPLDDHADLRRAPPPGGAPRAMSSPARRFRPGRRPARDDEVAHAREPGERVGPRAGRLGEPPHLGEPARDERRLRVVAEREAVRAARGERDDVLRRRAQLDAGHVVAHVDAEERPSARRPGAGPRARGRRSRRRPRPGARGRSHRRCSVRRAPRRVDPATSVDSRSPVAGSRPLREAEDRRVSRASAATTSPKTRLGTATTTSSASAIGAASIVAAAMPSSRALGRVARVPARLR